jgi:hypothetical protein
LRVENADTKEDVMLEIKTVRGTETREVVSQKEWLAARLAVAEGSRPHPDELTED